MPSRVALQAEICCWLFPLSETQRHGGHGGWAFCRCDLRISVFCFCNFQSNVYLDGGSLMHSKEREYTLYRFVAPIASTSSRVPMCSQLEITTLKRSYPLGPPLDCFAVRAIST